MMKIGNKEFDTENGIYVCGILNVTPDSFSDGGRYENIGMALEAAERMTADGAAIIDIGGQSTRPGFTEIPLEEECRRVVPVIERLKSISDVVISVDTFKYEVAEAALDAGADMINDVSCLRDERLAKLAARNSAAYCLMHNRDESGLPYKDLMDDIVNDLGAGIEKLKTAGVPDDKIMIDPGIGFAKTHAENLLVMRHFHRITEMGYPVMLGISRKSIIGKALGLEVGERSEGTIALNVFGIMNGVSFIRVHDVKGNYRAVKMIREVM